MIFYLWPQKGQNFSLKKEAFDTPLSLSIRSLNELKKIMIIIIYEYFNVFDQIKVSIQNS